jgi:hypothetical protein
MKKFKLTKNDTESLENVATLISNNVLKNAAIDVTHTDLSGGTKDWSRLAFAEVGDPWCQALPD